MDNDKIREKPNHVFPQFLRLCRRLPVAHDQRSIFPFRGIADYVSTSGVRVAHVASPVYRVLLDIANWTSLGLPYQGRRMNASVMARLTDEGQ